MVAGIDNWLFKWADNKICEPELNDDNTITCTNCCEYNCPYWHDYHEVKND